MAGRETRSTWNTGTITWKRGHEADLRKSVTLRRDSATMTAGLGAYLKEQRTGRVMTLDQVASSAQVSRRTLLRWEAGATLPRLPELEAVLQALGLTGLQRRHALALIEAPRAVLRLRQESRQDAVGEELGPLPLAGDLLRAM